MRKRASILELESFFIFFSCCLLAVRAWLFRWPGFHYDSIGFYAQGINYAAKGAFLFEGYTPFLLANPSGDTKAHGVLYQFFQSLAYRLAPSDPFLYLFAVNVATLTLIWLVIRRVGAKCNLFLWTGLHLLLPLSLSILLYLQGRPEHILMLIIGLYIFLVPTPKNDSAYIYLTSATVALIATSSPAPAIIFLIGILLLMAFIAETSGQLLAVSTKILLFSGLLWSFFLVVLTGANPLEYLVNSSAGGAARFSRIETFWGYLANPRYLLLGPLLAISVIYPLSKAKDSLSVLLRLIRCALVAIFLIALYLIAGRAPGTFYRIAPFVAAMPMGVELGSHLASSTRSIRIARIDLLRILFVILSISGIVAFQVLVSQPMPAYGDFERSVATYNSLKADLGPNEKIGVSPWGDFSFIPLDRPPWKMMSIEPPYALGRISEIEQSLGIHFKHIIISSGMGPGRLAIPGFCMNSSADTSLPAGKGHSFTVYSRSKDSSCP